MSDSSTQASIRRMSPADLGRVMEISASLKEAPRWPREAYCAALAPESTPPRIALVAETFAAGEVMGLLVASLMPPQAELEMIAVAAERQRHGLAGQLFSRLATELVLAGVHEVILEVRGSYQPALWLYRRLGFVETGRRPRYYRDPVEDAILMRLGL